MAMQMEGTGSQELGTGATSSQEPGLVLQQKPKSENNTNVARSPRNVVSCFGFWDLRPNEWVFPSRTRSYRQSSGEAAAPMQKSCNIGSVTGR